MKDEDDWAKWERESKKKRDSYIKYNISLETSRDGKDAQSGPENEGDKVYFAPLALSISPSSLPLSLPNSFVTFTLSTGRNSRKNQNAFMANAKRIKLKSIESVRM